ncbi:MAG: adenylate/guanylate cyclase domain-containing protein, partial [Candidatus Poribacteria bacterium]
MRQDSRYKMQDNDLYLVSCIWYLLRASVVFLNFTVLEKLRVVNEMECPKCKHINRDGAKFCEECGEKLQLKCPNCGAELRPNAKFCDECGERITAIPEGSTLAVTQTKSIPRLADMQDKLYVPEPLRQRMDTARKEIQGENRLVTALFADISGFTPLSNQNPTEKVVDIVNQCFKVIIDIVFRYEVEPNRFIGDNVLAFFGAPIAHENDPERAIMAALEIRDKVRELSLNVSIGINTGIMYFGPIGTMEHHEVSAYGPDINLAKRLQEYAEPGQILVGSGTYRLTRRAFDFDVIPSLNLRGFDQPITAYSVQQMKLHPEKLRGIEGLHARMIGREHEFADVKEAIDEWLEGHGQIVSVIGEAGIGKSRLVSELKGYIASKHTPNPSQEGSLAVPPLEKGGRGDFIAYLEGRCVSIGQPISYWPFIDILKTYFSLGEGDDIATIAGKVTDSITELMPQSADETLPLLGQLLSVKYGNELDDRLKFATPEQIRHQTLMRLRDIFTTLARKQPLLLILEDLHWSDDLSLDLISLLMDELANTPLMLLCIYRPEHEHRVWQLSNQARRKCMDRYIEIMLKPLSNIESRELIESLLEIDKLPETIKKMIMDKSEGNPFFIEEVIRSLIEQGMIYQQDDRWIAKDEISNINVPDTIQSVILSRVDRLQA